MKNVKQEEKTSTSDMYTNFNGEVVLIRFSGILLFKEIFAESINKKMFEPSHQVSENFQGR
uniref:Uncharacterized protein n=1 Tax=Arundo donax TaxID=35708 RepID=A0A0A9E4J0_ARUDO